MVYTLAIHDDAEADLDALWEDPITRVVSERIDVLLEELNCDQKLLDSLTDHGFGEYKTKPFHVSKWVEFWKQNQDIWRLKLWDLEAMGLQYRVVYAYDRWAHRYYILAVLPREFDYDMEHPRTKRIIDLYESIVGN